LAEKNVAKFPVKQNKTQTQEVYLYYFHIHDDTCLYLKQRQGKGIWENLFEFPMIESRKPLDFKELKEMKEFKEWFPDNQKYDFRIVIENKKHILSHRILYATFYDVGALRATPLQNRDDLIKIKQTDKEEYPVHRLMQYYWENTIG
jgi:A/G-specific adenine glycosylase